MPFSLYDITVPTFIKHLKALTKIIDKAVAHVGEGNESKILELRLIEDMKAFTYQIQRMSDGAKGVATRLGGAEPVVWEDNEKTIPEVRERIRKTIALLESLDPKSMDGKEEVEYDLFGKFTLTGAKYVLEMAIPNFFFHYTTAYALLRKEGVPIGKMDYIGMV
ncbi:Uncharacterized protein BP5553_00819 [Venustampulla echinocandica]|uniref:DUF1993 domain-containing protein n=1 Tax=Venustampulla echinocandica TaxID=2656787 RepID=A0A370TZ99_9HELO|nr:Uncharacterized protein BP5553_00819 [Venustampulla echinocandica]RDL40840.1 Uncharacterized protein BP5553_00819 [Venustampulla echinocandica]